MATAMRFSELLDVMLRRPRPDDERTRKAEEIEASEVKFLKTDRRVKRLLAEWRDRGRRG